MKTCKILSMEQSKNCPEMRYYKILYRGREYYVTTDLFDAPVYEVGATYNCETYKDKHGGLHVAVYGKKN